MESAEIGPGQQAREMASAMNLRVMLEDMEKQYYELKQNRDGLQEQLEQAQKVVREANATGAESQQLNSTINQLQLELQNAKSQAEGAKEEAKTIQERSSRVQAESDRLREEISRLNETNAKLGAQVASMEVDSKLQESEAIPLLHEKDRLRNEMESLQTHSNWLQGELDAKTAAYQRLQQESHDRQLQLQLQLQQTENDKESHAVREEELHKIEGRLQNKVEELSRDLMLARQETANLKESTALEIQQEQKLANLQKEHLVRWEQRYNDVIRENEAIKTAAADAQSMLNEQVEKARLEVETKYKQRLEDQAAAYQLRVGQSENALVPAAAALTEGGDEDDDDAPMGLTEVYQRLEQTKAQLRMESLRADRAELVNKRIVKEVEEKTPIMNRQRKEYELAMDQMQDYQDRLEQALREKDEAHADAVEARRVANQWKQQYDERSKETRILASQVQTLLVRSAGGDGGDESVPTSIATMQNQNQRLLLENQKWKDKADELERRLDEDALASKLEDAKSELESLHNQRKLQEEAVQKIVQQRDLYRSLCNVSGSMSSSQEITVQEFSKKQTERVKALETELEEGDRKLAVVTGERDKLLREKETTEERLSRYESHNKNLTESINSLEGEIRVARGDLARGQLEAKYHSDKAIRLDESVSRLRDEVGHVTSAKNELQRINAELQHSLTKANNLASQSEVEKQQAETRLRLVEAQAETAKMSQKRATDEATQLRAEVARQGTLIDSIRRIENSLTAKSEGEMQGLKEEVERLNKTVASERKRYEAELKNLGERTSEAEARFHEAIKAKDKSESELVLTKKALDDAPAKTAAPLSDVASQEKIDALSTELSAAKAEIASLRESADTYKKVAQGSESSMLEVSKAAASVKQTQQEEVVRLKALLANAQKDSSARQEMIVEMTQDLSGQREAREKAEAVLNTEITSLKSQLEVREKDFESSQAAVAAIKVDLDSLQSEVLQAQTNYERELKLHAEARSSLRTAMEKAGKAESERDSAISELSKLTTSIGQEKENWAQEKAALLESSQSLEKNIKETREQNNLLHSQLEKLGEQIQQSQAARADAAMAEGGESSNVSDKQLQEMREVVKFLRSENQMVQTQLDTVSRSAEREKAGAVVLKQSLEEARAELSALKDSTEAGKSSAAALEQTKEQLRSANEQVTLLTESNRLLREESERLRERMESVQKEVAVMKEKLAPSENEKLVQESKLVALNAEKESLRRELDSWKGRVESLVKKFNQVDPEEHRKALAQVEELTKEKESATTWKTNMEDENKRIREIARNVNQKLKDLRSQFDAKSKEAEKLASEKASLAESSAKEAHLTKERDGLKLKLQELNKSVASMKTELSGANDRNGKFREKLRQFQTKIRELQNSEKSLKAELESARSASANAAPTPKPDSTTTTATPVAPPASETTKVTGTQATVAKQASKAIDSGIKDKTQASTASVPAVPDGGFKFGPSPKADGTNAKDVDKPAEEEEDKKKSLRPDAAAFVPTKSTLPEKAPERPPIKRQGSGETMEMSVKEKLMAKKRKLAELTKRKLEAEKAIAKPDETEPAAKKPEELPGKKQAPPSEPAQKKVKKVPEQTPKSSSDSATEPATAPPAPLEPAKEAVVDPPKKSELKPPEPPADAAMSSKEKEGTGITPVAESPAPAVAAEKAENQSKPDTPFGGGGGGGGTFKNPFASGGTNPFGAGSATSKPFSFAVGGAVQAPAAAAAAPSAFLTNMKPPDSSSSPPTFSFGKTSSISLPIPAAPAPPSPFGAFNSSGTFPGSGAPFGGFAENQPMPSRPLFGESSTSGTDKEKEEAEETKKD